MTTKSKTNKDNQKDFFTKSIAGIDYYTASHPEIRKHYKKGLRPLEFGNKVWATTLVLLNEISQQETDFHGLRVLEIGCGWGLLSIFLAKQYACNVTASDFDENVLPLVEIQAKANHVSIQTKVSSFKDLKSDYLNNFDLIIGSEVCYSEEVAEDLTQLIDRSFSAGVKEILLADPGRPDFKDFMKKSRDLYQAEVKMLPGSVNGKETYLLSLKPHNNSY